jgi:hypothetical protein
VTVKKRCCELWLWKKLLCGLWAVRKLKVVWWNSCGFLETLTSGPRMPFTKLAPSLNDEWTPTVIIIFFLIELVLCPAVAKPRCCTGARPRWRIGVGPRRCISPGRDGALELPATALQTRAGTPSCEPSTTKKLAMNQSCCLPFGLWFSFQLFLEAITPSLNNGRPESVFLRQTQFSRDNHLETEGVQSKIAEPKAP